MATQIFNGTNQFAGYITQFEGDNAMISFTRSGASGSVDGGFLVQNYSVQFNRNVTLNRVLNRKGAIAQVGAGQGTLTLTGMVGTPDDFERLMNGTNSGVNADLCQPLTFIIKLQNVLTACNGAGNNVGKVTEIKVQNAICQGITLGGQVDQTGMLQQTANATYQFTGLVI